MRGRFRRKNEVKVKRGRSVGDEELVERSATGTADATLQRRRRRLGGSRIALLLVLGHDAGPLEEMDREGVKELVRDEEGERIANYE